MDSEGDRDPNAIVQPIPYSEKAGAQKISYRAPYPVA